MLICPSPAIPARSADSARPITTIPADLKNKGACFPCANDADPNERRRSIGNVPRAKASIISIPEPKDPLPNAETCIDCVKPHGRKNVAKPRMRGVKVLCSILLKKLKIPDGKAILFFAKTPTKFRPSNNITSAAKSPKIAVSVKLIPIAPPTAPSTPPNTAKLAILPEWNNKKVFVSLTLS